MTHLRSKALVVGREVSRLKMMEAFLIGRGYDVTLSTDLNVFKYLASQKINFISIDIEGEIAKKIYTECLSINVPILLISTSINLSHVSEWIHIRVEVERRASFISSVALLQLPTITLIDNALFYQSSKFLKLCHILNVQGDNGLAAQALVSTDIDFGYTILSKGQDSPLLLPRFKHLNFEFECFLNADSLKAIDPLPYFLQVLLAIPSLGRYSNQLFMVLSELFSNALEHGVLELSSALKNTPEGFSAYFIERSHRLSKITSGYVVITLGVEYQNRGGMVTVVIEDSGKGYRKDLIPEKVNEENTPYNRGLYLVKQLCEEVIVSEKGNKSKVIFKWTD